jgi:23S rRNA maturation-related 3'-5' exoribonuclease YhaM
MAKKKEVEEQVATPATVAEAVNNATIIKTALLKTKREGMEGLIERMTDIGFFTAPCSGGNHLAKTGGLAEHSLNVMRYAEKIGVALYGGAEYNKIQDSVVIASLLHDLGKCGDYGKQMYVDNILKSGKQSEAKPFKRNTDLSAVPHAVRSVKIATLFIDFTEDEEWAILCHDGLYDFMKYEMQGHETPLQLIIHWADMWASHVVELGSEQEGDE